MRPDRIPRPPTRARRCSAGLAIALAVALASASCGSSPQKIEVLGVIDAPGTSTDVGLIDAVCITNSPTNAPC